MSSGEVRRVTRHDIQKFKRCNLIMEQQPDDFALPNEVQNLIERCLHFHMNKREVMNCLLVQAEIEPVLTELVWQKLEEENHEFFKAYHVQRLVKKQIEVFEKLLEQQVKLMPKMPPAGASMPGSNGSQMPQCQTVQPFVGTPPPPPPPPPPTNLIEQYPDPMVSMWSD